MPVLKKYLVTTITLAAALAAGPALANVSTNKAIINAQSQAADNSEHLKLKALDALRAGINQRLQATYPAATRVSIYLDVAVKRFILQRAVLSIDQKVVKTRDYSKKEALALLQRGTDRLLRFNATPGKHHLHIKYSGHLQGSSVDKAPVSGEIDLDIQTKPNAQAYILPVAPEALSMVRRSLAAKQKKENWKWQTEAQDPRLDYVRFLTDTQGPTPTLLELLEIAGPRDTSESLSADYYLLIARTYVDLGLPNKALAAIRNAWGKVSDRAALAETSLRLAQLQYHQGDYSIAEQLLQSASQDLAPSRRLVWQDLLSRALMAQRKYDEATNVLAQANQRLDSGPQNHEEFPETTIYLRYNYAIALIKSGRTAAGRTLLDRIGQAKFSGKFAQAVRDQANLSLGYNFLHNAQGATAKAVFERMPRNGRYANLALLGLGWAELAPTGSRQPQASPGTYGDKKTTGNFEQARMGNNNSARLTNALAAWNTLAQRNTSDPAVQQALLAIPNAMQDQGQHTQAADGYQRAITAYTHARNALQAKLQKVSKTQARTALAGGNLTELAQLGRIHTVGETYASYAYQAHFSNRHALAQLRTALLENNGPHVLTDELQQAGQTQLAQAQQALVQSLKAQIQRLDKFEIDARFGLARAYEQASNNTRQPHRTLQVAR